MLGKHCDRAASLLVCLCGARRLHPPATIHGLLSVCSESQALAPATKSKRAAHTYVLHAARPAHSWLIHCLIARHAAPTAWYSLAFSQAVEPAADSKRNAHAHEQRSRSIHCLIASHAASVAWYDTQPGCGVRHRSHGSTAMGSPILYTIILAVTVTQCVESAAACFVA